MNRKESKEKIRLRFTLLPFVKKQISIFQEKEKEKVMFLCANMRIFKP